MAMTIQSPLFTVCFVWISFLVVSIASVEVQIRPSGDKFVKPIASNAVFSCHVTDAGSSDVKIQWFDKDSRPIAEDPSLRIYVEKGSDRSRKLYIRVIEENDAGKYSCLVTVDGAKTEKSVELSNFKEITFDHAPNPQHPELHCNARIECQVSGSPSPTVSWRFNGNAIEESGRYVKEPNGLVILNITQADNGNYTCRAEVEADGRYDERTITVIVHIGPAAVVGPGNLEGIEGQAINMSCRAGGLPPPRYEFFKESKPKEWKVLLPSDRIHIDSDAGRVEFRKLAKEDEGVYLCRALNDVGSKDSQGHVKVFVRPKIQDIKSLTVDEGKNAVLACKSSGDPPPVMTFQKIGNAHGYKNGSNDEGRVFVESRGRGHYEMQIKGVTPSDRGSYVCRAHNAIGDHKATGNISVRYKPFFPKDQSNVVFSWAGRVHNITCSPDGEPAPGIVWRRMNTDLPDNDTFRIFSAANSSSLQIRVKEADQGWIYGEYVCVANNSLGSANFKFTLKRATVPDIPRSVTVKEILPNLIRLSIEPPKETGGVRLVGYRVEFNRQVHDFSIIDPDDRSANRNQSFLDDMKIENLKPATNYTFRIRAKNEVGVGSNIEKVVTTANFTKPSPIHFTSPTRSHDSNTYKVKWEKPKTGGKPIKEYEIRYKKVRSLPSGNVQSEEDWKIERRFDTSNQPMLDFTLSELAPNTQYSLEVLARNEIGFSKPEGVFYFWTSAQPQLGHSSRAAAAGSSGFVWLPAVALIKILVSRWTGFV